MAEDTVRASFLSSIGTSFALLLATENDDLFRALQRSLEPFGYRVTRAKDGKQALDLCRSQPPDLIVTEAQLKVLNGFELCRAIKSSREGRIIPVLFLTSFFDADAKVKALQMGADDFLYKPVNEAELRARVRSLLRVKAYYTRLENEREHLDLMVRQRTRELDELTFGLVAALEKASSLNDADTGGHIKRVCAYSFLLGKTIGLADSVVAKIRRYASLHDVGKVGLPDRILKKEGPLTSEEREQMKQHTILGYELLVAAKADPIARNIALAHHEKFDGSGYPRGQRGDEIPIEGRIVAMADVFDALSTRRCYKTAMSFPEASDLIALESGRHFDPNLVEAFKSQQAAFRTVYNRYRDYDEMGTSPIPPEAITGTEEPFPWE